MTSVKKILTTGVILLVASAGSVSCSDDDVPAPVTVTVTEMPNDRGNEQDSQDDVSGTVPITVTVTEMPNDRVK